MPHKPSKYHYHMKIDQIYGDKILKLCGQCTQPTNLARDLRFLDKNMKRSLVSISDDSDPTSSDTTTLSSLHRNRASHHSQSLPISQQIPSRLKKLNTRELLVLHRSSMQTLDSSANKFDIEFDVLDLSSGRQSGPNLPIIVLPPDLFRFTQLKRLHLDCNQIRVVPDELGQKLINLEILTLSNNCLKVFRNGSF